MKFRASWVVTLLLASAPTFALAQATVYWDVNGTAAGGGPIGDGTWGAPANWNPLADGTGTPAAWVAGDHAVFSAGTDVQGDPIVDAQITITGTQVAASALIEEGFVLILSGKMDTGPVTVNSGAHLSTTTSLNIEPITALTGTITLNGGKFSTINFGHAGSFIRPTQSIVINGSGTLEYDDTVVRTANDCQCTIYTPGTGHGIKGGGPGIDTLTKTGAGEIRVQGASIPNFSFDKLVVQEGLYRIGSTSTVAGTAELGFGLTPSSLMTDQITLDGGEIGASLSMTLSANRGITITSNGGIFNNGGAGVMTILGPITGSGKMTLNGVVTSPTSANHGVSSGGTTLSNVNNVNTFSGDVEVNTSTLTLVESLTTPNFSGGVVVTPPPTPPASPGFVSAPVTTIGTVSIASGKTFTAGSGGLNTSYAGRVTGAGTFRKVGAGTLTLDSGQTVHWPGDPGAMPPIPGSTVANFTGEWTNTGGVIIDEGSIKFNTALAGFGTLTPVTIASGATLDMNSINDTFGSLNGAGSVSRTTGNLTLAIASGTATFTGTIDGTGNLTKGRTLPTGAGDVGTQVLDGNNSMGALTVNAGTLRLNGTNTTGAVTVNGGTLGGSGSVSGAVTVNSGGHIAPGNSAGILTVGSASLLDGSILDIEIGGTTFPTDFDRLASPGAISLDGILNVTLINGYTPANNDSVHIVTAGGGITGTFDTVNLPTIPGVTWDLDYNPNSVAITALIAPTNDADFNGDGVIDNADYVVWRKFNPTAAPNATQGTGDADGDGDNDAADYDLFVNQFNNPSPGSGGGGAVPEPTTVAMLLIGLAALAGRRRGR